MSTPIPKSLPNTGTANTETAKVDSTATSATPAPPPPKPQPDPKAAAKAAQGSKQHATERKSQQSTGAHIVQKNLQKQIPDKNADNVWESVKQASQFAADVANTGARAIGEATATAGAAQLAEKANKAVQDGYRDARGKALAEEVKRVGSGNSSFSEKEELIKKIDAYRREGTEGHLETSGIYDQETMRAPRKEYYEMGPMKVPIKRPIQVDKFEDKMDKQTGGLTEVLGPYGYYPTNRSSKIPGEDKGTTQREILDTALHNWRVTSPKDRFTLSTRKPGDALPPPGFDKDWKTPPDARLEDRATEAEQVVQNPQTKGNYMGYPAPRPRATQPDPEQVLAQGQHNLENATIDLINSVGGGVAAKSGRTNAGKRGTAPEWNVPGQQSKSSNVPRNQVAVETRNQVTVETGKSDIGSAKTQQAPAQPAPAKPAKNVPAETAPDGLAGRGPAAPAKGKSDLSGGTELRPRRPDPNDMYTIKTPKGSEDITFSQYKERWDAAKRWVEQERTRLTWSGNASKSTVEDKAEQLYIKAQEKFGLQNNWQYQTNNPLSWIKRSD